MKLSSKLEKVLNDQINLEFCSAYAYLGMAAYFEGTAFTGFGKWMELQSKEELGHANRFFKYIVERGGKVTLQAITEPKCDYKSPLDAFKASLGHEQRVSAAICAIRSPAPRKRYHGAPKTIHPRWSKEASALSDAPAIRKALRGRSIGAVAI